MPNLVEIQPQNPAEDVVETIEKALALAHDGKVSAVSVVLVYRDGGVGHRASTLPNNALMIGALVRCIHKLNRWADDELEVVP